MTIFAWGTWYRSLINTKKMYFNILIFMIFICNYLTWWTNNFFYTNNNLWNITIRKQHILNENLYSTKTIKFYKWMWFQLPKCKYIYIVYFRKKQADSYVSGEYHWSFDDKWQLQHWKNFLYVFAYKIYLSWTSVLNGKY